MLYYTLQQREVILLVWSISFRFLVLMWMLHFQVQPICAVINIIGAENDIGRTLVVVLVMLIIDNCPVKFGIFTSENYQVVKH